jgi:hypothetical protein
LPPSFCELTEHKAYAIQGGIAVLCGQPPRLFKVGVIAHGMPAKPEANGFVRSILGTPPRAEMDRQV